MNIKSSSFQHKTNHLIPATAVQQFSISNCNSNYTYYPQKSLHHLEAEDENCSKQELIVLTRNKEIAILNCYSIYISLDNLHTISFYNFWVSQGCHIPQCVVGISTQDFFYISWQKIIENGRFYSIDDRDTKPNKKQKFHSFIGNNCFLLLFSTEIYW